MVKIRLSRNGSKKKPFYQITVTDSRNARNGNFIEKLGFFNPILKNKKSMHVKLDRINYWSNKGAKISNRVQYILKKISKNNL